MTHLLFKKKIIILDLDDLLPEVKPAWLFRNTTTFAKSSGCETPVLVDPTKFFPFHKALRYSAKFIK